MSVIRHYRILPGVEEVAREAAREFLARARQSVRAHDRFVALLSGGSTPRRLYELLAEEPALRNEVPWDRCHFFFGDERHVSPDHPDSNYGMAERALFSRVPVPAAQVQRIPSEIPDAWRAAERYERQLREFPGLKEGPFPRFDLTLLGMGEDGHTASIFPGSPVLQEQERLAVATWVKEFESFRITVTPGVLNHSAAVLFLVTGIEKAETVRRVLEGEYQPQALPAQMVRPKRGEVLWLLERAAASLLSPPTPRGGRGRD